MTCYGAINVSDFPTVNNAGIYILLTDSLGLILRISTPTLSLSVDLINLSPPLTRNPGNPVIFFPNSTDKSFKLENGLSKNRHHIYGSRSACNIAETAPIDLPHNAIFLKRSVCRK